MLRLSGINWNLSPLSGALASWASEVHAGVANGHVLGWHHAKAISWTCNINMSDVSRWRHRFMRPLVGIFRGSYSHEPRFTLGIEFHFKAREYCCYDLWKVINNSGTSWARIGWASRRESRTSPPVETLFEQLCHLIQIEIILVWSSEAPQDIILTRWAGIFNELED